MRAWWQFGGKLGGLTLGFVLGQGSVFALQTWFVAQGRLAEVASFGTAVACLSLLQWTADWGGLFLLSREVGTRGIDGIWSANLARFAVAVPLLIGAAAFASSYASVDAFVSSAILGGMPVALFWAFNLSGTLDGLGKSAVAGPLTALPWMAAAATMAWGGPGGTVGAAFAVGGAVCVVAQYALVGSLPRQPRRREVVAFLRDGALYCAAEFPNQLFGRMVIFVLTAGLGAHLVGIYIYIRQILVGFGQIIGFINRIEFPRLARLPDLRPMTVLAVQAINLTVAVLVLLGALVLYGVRAQLSPQMAEIAYYGVFFAAGLPAWALATSFGQAIIVRRDMSWYLVVMTSGVAFRSLAIVAAIPPLGLVFLAWCDIVTFLTQALLFSQAHRIRHVAAV